MTPRNLESPESTTRGRKRGAWRLPPPPAHPKPALQPADGRLAASRPAEADLVLDEMEEGVLIADARSPGLTVVHANPGFTRATGYPAGETRGQPLFFAIDADADGELLEATRSAALRGERATAELRYRRRDGAPVWFRLTLCPVTADDGSVVRLIAIHLDVTDRRLVVDALREKNEALTEALQSLQKTKEAIVQRERMHALGKMASGIVHDFNNLLAPILGFTELLLTFPEMMEDPARVASYLQKIRTAANDGAAVVGRLREFYRSRDDAETRGPFSVRRATEQTLELTRHRWRNEAQARGQEIEVVAHLQETAPVFGLAAEFRQALTNLVLNAVDAMPGGGTLRLRTYGVGNWVCIQVADTGLGMSTETRRRCFEPFFTTKGKSGTGLGLSIVFGIVERHRGRVDLQSEPGQGTAVTLWLPAGETGERVPEATAFPDTGRDARPLHVMLVDDEDLLLEVVSENLLGMGHSVDCFTDPRAALDRFQHRHYDLVITDRAMPGMTGEQLAAGIRAVRGSTPIILLTGFDPVIHDAGEPPEHISEVVAKPLSQERLCELLARHGRAPVPEAAPA